MRNPPLELYDADHRIEPEQIDMSDVVPIKVKRQQETKQAHPASKDYRSTEESNSTVSRNRDNTVPSNHETVIPRHHDTVEIVRRAVKAVGKEAATHRFTIEEKRALAEIIFHYGQKGIKTSENEIARIAINYLIEDHTQNGETSILARVLHELSV